MRLRLWSYATRLTGGDRGRAEDAVQETMLRAWRHPEVLDPSRGSPRGWLFTTLRHVVIDEWRARSVRPETVTDRLPEPSVPDAADTAVQSWLVAERFDSCAVRTARCSVECFYRGLSVAEAAARLVSPRHREVPYALRTTRPETGARGDGGDGVTCFFVHDGASYVIGALSPEDRHRFEEHLPTCAECTETVRELSGMPGLLARLPGHEAFEAAEEPEPPPPSLLPRLLTQVARERRTARWRVAAVAAAAAVAVGVGSAAVVTTVGDHSGTTPGHAVVAAGPLLTMRAVGGAPVKASVRLTPKSWGTAIDMRCTYLSNPGWNPDGGSYALVATDRNGHREQLATWQAIPNKEVRVPTATSVARKQLTSLQVTSHSGKVLATVGV